MVEQAVRNQWEIPDKAYRVLPAEMIRLAADRTLKPRERTSAARVLSRMHGQNQADDPPDQTMNHNHRIDVESLRRQMIAEPGYAEYARQEMISAQGGEHVDGDDADSGRGSSGDDQGDADARPVRRDGD